MANLSGAGAPTKNTVGTVGDIYTNINNGKQYKCVTIIGIDDSDDPAKVAYEWDEMTVETSGGGGGSNNPGNATTPTDDDALDIITEMNFIDLAGNDGCIFTDANGVIYTL